MICCRNKCRGSPNPYSTFTKVPASFKRHSYILVKFRHSLYLLIFTSQTTFLRLLISFNDNKNDFLIQDHILSSQMNSKNIKTYQYSNSS